MGVAVSDLVAEDSLLERAQMAKTHMLVEGGLGTWDPANIGRNAHPSTPGDQLWCQEVARTRWWCRHAGHSSLEHEVLSLHHSVPFRDKEVSGALEKNLS